MTRLLGCSSLVCLFAMAWLLSGCCEGSGDSTADAGPGVHVASPRMPSDWEVERDFVTSRPETAALGTQMKAKLVGVRNTVYSVKGGRVQINTIRAASPRDAMNVVRHLQNIKPTEFVLRNKNTVLEFVGRDDVLPQIKTGREHLLNSRQGFKVKVAPGGHHPKIKRHRRDAGDRADGGAIVDGG